MLIKGSPTLIFIKSDVTLILTKYKIVMTLFPVKKHVLSYLRTVFASKKYLRPIFSFIDTIASFKYPIVILWNIENKCIVISYKE